MIDWEPILFRLMWVVTIVAWIAGFIITTVAIFIDRAPAEGNLGGFAAVLFVIAIVLTFCACAWWDNR